mmetsp:Transcript_120004/g.233651  ORF Transcript_120004/g.233651 Transcript_120004/m.233651 type:complete len:357 (-) Transcript_120004:131-1201(-)
MGAGLCRWTRTEKLPRIETQTEARWAAPRSGSSRSPLGRLQRRAKEGFHATSSCDAACIASEQTPGAVAPVSPVSPKSLASSCSDVHRWFEPSETVIIFDWDDTLFPTSYLQQHHIGQLGTSKEQPAEFLENATKAMHSHIKVVDNLLRLAGKLGQVLIVTMATEIWVNLCVEKHIPGFRDLLEAVGAQVVAARSGVPVDQQRQACSDDRDPSQYLKTRAMQRAVRDFYNEGRRRSWKNLLSIGDSSAERCALQDIVFRRVQRNRHGRWKECRCKTLTLMQEPSLEQLTTQLQRVTQSLPALVTHDGDVDAILDRLDDVLCNKGTVQPPTPEPQVPSIQLLAVPVDMPQLPGTPTV